MWLVGSPRSGSTWLLKLLAEHPDVATVNEPLIGDHLAPFMSDQPGISPADLDTSNFTLSRLRGQGRDYFFAERYSRVWQPLLGELIRARLHAQVVERQPQARCVVVKEPHGSQAADMILAALPNARLLFLLRDGRDVVDSEVAAFSKGSWLTDAFGVVSGIETHERLQLVEDASYKWLWRTLVVEEAFARHSGPKTLLRYEALRAEPVAELRTLIAWLGLDADLGSVEEWVDRHSFERIPEAERGPNKIYRSAEPGSWRNNLTAAEQEKVESIIGQKLVGLGYK